MGPEGRQAQDHTGRLQAGAIRAGGGAGGARPRTIQRGQRRSSSRRSSSRGRRRRRKEQKDKTKNHSQRFGKKDPVGLRGWIWDSGAAFFL